MAPAASGSSLLRCPVPIPRYVLLVHGLVLAALCLGSFILGISLGGTASRHSPAASRPVTVDIRVQAASAEAGVGIPEPGAMVLLIPGWERPDVKWPVEVVLGAWHGGGRASPLWQAVTDFGACLGKTNDRGHVTLRLPRGGTYYLLVMSAERTRPPDRYPRPQDLAELGRYVESSADLLGDRLYQWQVLHLESDQSITIVL